MGWRCLVSATHAAMTAHTGPLCGDTAIVQEYHNSNEDLVVPSNQLM